jgi:type II restriction/modification system DNA methylase subunit YeeA
VATNLSVEELPGRLDDFVRYRQEFLAGDEKGEAQVFLDRFFRAFGHDGVREAGATLEQRVARRDNRGTAFADLVWKPRVLIEMKKASRDLQRDYRQAFEYWIDLVPDRPEYVVLCNFDEFWVFDFNRQLDEPVDKVALTDLPRRWEAMAFLLPEQEEPVFGNDLVAVTRATAAMVSRIFNRMVERGVDREVAQRFILQAVMAMFAEDIGLLPRHLFTRAVEDVVAGGSAYDLLFGLFREMNTENVTSGGRFEGTPYFNGGLYATITPCELTTEEVVALGLACQEDWAAVRPVIFGTLFEQSLDKPERHAYGAYFTSEADIQQVVLPTIVRPWRARIEAAETLEDVGQVEQDLLDFSVLDPACGSGNFLYVAYREMRRLEHQLDEKRQDISRRAGRREEMRLRFVSTRQFFGVDKRPFAVEVAKVTLMLGRKLAADELGDEHTYLPLDDLDDNFVVDDALRVDWPAFDACIGNPPYLGRRRIIEEHGAAYSAWLSEQFPDVRGLADYVVYWFRKAHDLLPAGGRAGLVGTNSIRDADSRRASLDYIIDHGGVIYDAVSSKPWSGDAVVEVSIVNWAKELDVQPKTLWLTGGTTKLEVEAIPGRCPLISMSPKHAR